MINDKLTNNNVDQGNGGADANTLTLDSSVTAAALMRMSALWRISCVRCNGRLISCYEVKVRPLPAKQLGNNVNII